MRKLIAAFIVAVSLIVGASVPVFADPPTSACNGLDTAHGQIHASGTQAELKLHDLRTANHCH